MRKLHFALLLLSLSFLFSCQQEIDFTQPTDPASTLNTYHPLTAGTYWKYRDTASGSTRTLTVLSQTKTINGAPFTMMVGVAGTQTDTMYASVQLPNYYHNISGSSPSGGTFDILLHYLNESAPVGNEWEYTAGQGNGFAAIIKTKIIEKDISVTVDTITYSNVIHSQMKLSYDIAGMVIEYAQYDYYSAKNVGIVRIRSTIGGIVWSTIDLFEYHIQQ